METVQALMAQWLPIVASAAAVWVASALAWMLINHHCKDWNPLPNEEAGMAAIRGLNLPPGCYGFPHMDKASCKTPEGKAKWEKGPMGMLRVWRTPNMGANMAATMVVYLVISVLIAYLGVKALTPPHDFAQRFQVLGTAGILAYTFGGLCGDIWFQQSKRAMVMNIIDGVVYGLITGAIFAWLWAAR